MSELIITQKEEDKKKWCFIMITEQDKKKSYGIYIKNDIFL